MVNGLVFMNFANPILQEIFTIKRGLRRKFYMYLRPGYVKRQMETRIGFCGGHGCCDLSVFHKHRRCLSKKDRTKCLKWKNLPRECKIYPLDEKDKIPETRKYCNFHWKKEINKCMIRQKQKK